MESSEFYNITEKLMAHHAFFSEVWEMGKPVFVEGAGTAYVRLAENGECLEFAIDPNFWATLNDHNKMFVICHEIQHVVLRHGTRSLNYSGPVNEALDLPINEALVKHFGFCRNEWTEQFCWVDNLLPGEETNKAFEYYIEKLIQQNKGSDDCNGCLLNEHDRLAECEDAIDKILNKVSPAAKTDIAGKLPGGVRMSIEQEKPVRIQWNDILAKILPDNDSETWAFNSRRMEASGLRIPGLCDDCNEVSDVYLFLDVSGSCAEYAKHFFQIAKSIPQKHTLHLHTFNMEITPISIDDKEIKVGGGTSYKAIVDYLSDKDAKQVILVTDSYGDVCKPENPDRWTFLLTEEKYNKGMIPKGAVVYFLKDIEM